jgi:hypothetical protein
MSASAVFLLCQYLAIVMHEEEIQREGSSVCIRISGIVVCHTYFNTLTEQTELLSRKQI